MKSVICVMKKIMATPFTNYKMIPDTPFYINCWCFMQFDDSGIL